MLTLTDAQIVRVFRICNEIAAVQAELPIPPRGFDVGLEIARNLRTSLEQHAASLNELADLLVDGNLFKPDRRSAE